MRRAVDVLRKLCPKAHPNYLAGFDAGDKALVDYDVTTPLRLAHFLAQLCHESAGLTALRESGSYSAGRIVEIFGVGKHTARVTPAEAKGLARNGPALFERVYGLGNPRKARELGNNMPGDAWRYRGGGLPQLTGGNLYRLYGFGTDPEAITSAARCLEPALKIWRAIDGNKLADANDIRAITKAWNGGYNGYEDRVAWFNKLWPALRESTEPVESWKAAEPLADTYRLQEKLNQLGYGLKLDGRVGPKTTAAVVDFQRKNNLRVDGIPGGLTMAAIDARIAATKPTIGAAQVSTGPAVAGPAAGGFTVAMIGEAGSRLVAQADTLRQYASLSRVVEYGCLALTVAGIAIVVIGIGRAYLVPALWPPKAAVPE